jgi:hypothetical protein
MKPAVRRRGTAPDPRMGVAIDLSHRNLRGKGGLLTIGEALAGVGGSTKASPPRFDAMEPTGPDGG